MVYHLCMEVVYLVFLQAIFLLLLLFGGKKIFFLRYIIILDLFIWYLRLQAALKTPSVTSDYLLEFFLILLMLIYSFRIYWKQIKEKEIAYQKNELQKQVEMYKLQISQITAQEEKIQLLKHDLKNKFISLKSLIDGQEYSHAKLIIDESLDTLSPQKHVSTGNISLDSLINYKIEYALQNSIKINHQVLVPPDEFYNSQSVITVLGNIFDNAIEASLKLPNELRSIHLNILRKDTRTIIQMQNNFDGNLQFDKKGKLLSSKREYDSHGMGMRSLKLTLQGIGDFSYSIDDKIFTVNIIFY